MKRCLNEKELLAVHAGEGSNEARSHLESCLSCAREYRVLQGDMETLITALKQPGPYAIRPRALAFPSAWPRGLGWSLAASAVVAAFVCGRVTGLDATGSAFRSSFSPAVASIQSSPRRSGTQVAMVDGEGSQAPAAYGLYIDDLMDSDVSDQGQATDDQDTDETDADASSF